MLKESNVRGPPLVTWSLTLMMSLGVDPVERDQSAVLELGIARRVGGHGCREAGQRHRYEEHVAAARAVRAVEDQVLGAKRLEVVNGLGTTAIELDPDVVLGGQTSDVIIAVGGRVLDDRAGIDRDVVRGVVERRLDDDVIRIAHGARIAEHQEREERAERPQVARVERSSVHVDAEAVHARNRDRRVVAGDVDDVGRAARGRAAAGKGQAIGSRGRRRGTIQGQAVGCRCPR